MTVDAMTPEPAGTGPRTGAALPEPSRPTGTGPGTSDATVLDATALDAVAAQAVAAQAVAAQAVAAQAVAAQAAVANTAVPDTPVAVADRPARASLSPSRAADFKTCPLLYRFRSIDRLPEQPTADQARGTLVHAVLERLFDLPAPERTVERAADLIVPQWERLVIEDERLLGLFADGGTPEEFRTSARSLLEGYFAVEDPRRLTPAEREFLVTTEVDDGRLLLRGYIDRLDVSATGDLRVVDYKTGGAPREAFEARALFQLKFYALVLWRTRGVVPRVLRLLYLKDAEVCDYTPDTEELARFERTLVALWAAIEKATAERDFRPKPSRLCGWCAHQALCPAFDGTPPPFPEFPPRPAEPDGPVTDE